MQEQTSVPDPPAAHRRLLPRRRARALVASLAVAALPTACAGIQNGGASTGPDGTKQVTIGKAVDTIGFTTADVAQDKGYFKKQGVSTEQELLGGSSTAFAALQSGSVQFVDASSTALLNARTKDVPLQAVASLDYGVSLQLAASTSWTKKHHMNGRQPLKTVMRGLSGATLGVVSTTDLTYYHYLMKQAGVSPGKFRIITIKTQSAALAAVQHGQIDAFLLSPPNSYYAQSKGQAQIIATLHDVPVLRRMTYDVLVTTQSYAKAHPDIVKAVATGAAEADNAMAKDPRSVLDVERKHYHGMSDDVLLQSLKYVTFAPDGQMAQDGWEDVRKEAVESDVPDASTVDVGPGSGVWTNQYIVTGKLHSGTGGG